MSKPKDPAEMQRPNRRLGDVIRALVGCPLCRVDPEGLELRVVAYRRRSIRLECRLCGLRFSVDEETLAQAIGREPTSFTNTMALAVLLRHEVG